jgi:tRNA-dihydrouridine synthase B
MGNLPALRLGGQRGAAAPLILAPLEGITTSCYRRVLQRRCGGFDGAIAPFIGTIRRARRYDYHLRDILPERAASGLPLIPQVLGADPEGIRFVARACAELGYTQLNWNIGCPIPNIVRKRRGSGILPHPGMVERVLDEIRAPGFPAFSVKLRTGLEESTESLELQSLFNSAGIDFLVLHPRTGRQMYTGSADRNSYAAFLSGTRHPLVWSGDIVSRAQFTELSALFPETAGWLLGRGVLMRPFLAREIRERRDIPFGPGEALEFLAELAGEYLGCGSDRLWLLSKMKQHFAYLRKGCDDRDGAELLWRRMRTFRRWEQFAELAA